MIETMEHTHIKKPSPHPDILIQTIIERVRGYYPSFQKSDQLLIEKAYAFAKDAHEGQVRASGSPYIMHSLRATEILLSIKPDLETICGCILHDVIGDTQKTADDIEAVFGGEIRFLCEGVERITQVRITQKENQSEYEKFQQLFVALADDIRIIFIKLADRIHNLKTLHFLPREKWNRILHESQEVYSPVADRLRLFEFKTLIENYCIEILHPEISAKIKQEIHEIKESKHKFFEKAEREIRQVLVDYEIEWKTIMSREKSLESIYKKFKTKNINSVHELSDIFGLRIIVTTKEECYHTLGVLHSEFQPIPKRFKDYIAVPKPNGYQSLHTTLLGVAGNHFPIEVQIRTETMHNDCEYGPAAHWAYKKLKSSSFDNEYLEKTRWISEEVEQERAHDPKKFFEAISKRVLQEQIYVFTRKGDIKILPHDATPIDFAYSIHTDIGDSCVGAKINNHIRPLDYRLKSGDIIEILTKKGRTPNPEWLEFVQTSKAKNKIKAFVNMQKKEEKKDLVGVQKTRERERERKQFFANSLEPLDNREYSLIIDGEQNISYRIAKCCQAGPKKSIIAYHSRGLGSVIHESGCDEIERLDSKRLVEAYFVIQKKIEVLAKDRFQITNRISQYITNRNISIWETKIKHIQQNIIRLRFTLHVMNDFEFAALIKDLSSIETILSIREQKIRKR